MNSPAGQTGTGEQSRIEFIKKSAATYDQLDSSEKLKLLQFIRQDLIADRNRRAAELQALDAVLGEVDGSTPKPTPVPRPTPKPSPTPKPPKDGRSKGGMTYQEAIKAALKGAGTLSNADLFNKANKLAGGKLKKSTFAATLPGMKKNKEIKSAGRGAGYSLA